MGESKRVVIALGGNALQSGDDHGTSKAQLEIVKKTCKGLADIWEKGYEIVLVHGNGPQVGRIIIASEAGKNLTPSMPFDVCGAMSQGYIGYHIQQALGAELDRRGCDSPVVTLVTQVVVKENDPSFENPTKPIGTFYSKAEAGKIYREQGYPLKEDSGRGYRRLVASPMPLEIVEIEGVRLLLKKAIVITCGGGGIPVLRKKDKSLEGVAAVIDKDFAAELLAEEIDADILLILTEVENASLYYNQANQKDLGEITSREAEAYILEGHFSTGSMLPKMEAAIKFVKSGKDKVAIISSLGQGLMALDGKTGTIIRS